MAEDRLKWETLNSLFEGFVAGNEARPLTVDELKHLSEFTGYIDSLSSRGSLLGVAQKEKEFEELISKSLTDANEKYTAFKLEWREKPTVYASLRSIYMHAQITISTMIGKEERSLHIPMYYPAVTWSLLCETNLEAEIMSLVASSIIKSLRSDMSSQLIDPTNFDQFTVYNLEVTNYTYGHSEIVLEVLSTLDNDQVSLFYVWDVLEGQYKRKDLSSSLATKHNGYKDLAEKLKR